MNIIFLLIGHIFTSSVAKDIILCPKMIAYDYMSYKVHYVIRNQVLGRGRGLKSPRVIRLNKKRKDASKVIELNMIP
jgi:hypothetical protein